MRTHVGGNQEILKGRFIILEVALNEVPLSTFIMQLGKVYHSRFAEAAGVCEGYYFKLHYAWDMKATAVTAG